jgi:hypothetical protein
VARSQILGKIILPLELGNKVSVTVIALFLSFLILLNYRQGDADHRNGWVL